MNILAMDTSNQTLAVSLLADGQVLANHISTTNKNHSTALMPVINQLCHLSKLAPTDIDRIAVAKGPGSYTGLRIGVTTAKTLAWTLDADLVGVSSLAVLAANSVDYTGFIIPVFDARRDNIYTGVYQWQHGRLQTIIPDQHIAFSKWLDMIKTMGGPVRFVMEAKEQRLFGERINQQFANTLAMEPTIHTINAISLARLAMEETPEVDVINFVPTYLKLVEAEEQWLKTHHPGEEDYVERV